MLIQYIDEFKGKFFVGGTMFNLLSNEALFSPPENTLFTNYPWIDYLLRILLALVLGFCVGLERKSRSKEAGIRTHTLVAVGAALYTIISKYGFNDTANADTARIAAQIVSGVGFLGAGMIMHQRQMIHGLTTAAGVWATAGIGMAAAAGLYIVATGTTLFIVFVQLFLHTDIKFFKMKRFHTYKISFVDLDDAQSTLLNEFSVKKFARIKTEKREDNYLSIATIKTEKELPGNYVKNILEKYSFVQSCEIFGDDIE